MRTSQLDITSNISKQRGSSADYNGNNSWYFNGTNGCLNNNNRYNGNFRCRPVLDYDWYNNEYLESYPIPLSEWLLYSIRTEQGKKRKPSYVFYVLHRVEELVELCHEVGNYEVMPREGTAHIVFEPRVREIVCASTIRRVLQTFYITSLQPYLEKYMYHEDSYSCRPGKGGLKAVMKLQDYLFEATNGYKDDCWVAKVDIQAFFMNLDCHQVCKIVTDFIDKHLSDHPHKELLKYLTRVIYLGATKDHIKDMAKPHERAKLDPKKSIYNQPYYHGVPIGDWTSQTAGLIITTEPLRYLESLGYKFVHYTDDTTIVVNNKEQWLEDIDRLERYYKYNYGLSLHPNKRYLQHIGKGVELLGYKLRYNRVLPSDRIYHNIMWYIERTIRKANENKSYGLTHKDKILSSVNSYLGMLRHMSSYKLRKEICEAIKLSQLGEVFDIGKGFTKIIIKDKYTDKTYYKQEYKKLKKTFKYITI